MHVWTGAPAGFHLRVRTVGKDLLLLLKKIIC